ncbi:MAG: hypothetical protein ACRDBQ_18395 [Shewanella sp.]
MAKYNAKEIYTWNDFDSNGPARPENYQCDGLWVRIKLAFGVFIGRYDALDWSSDGKTFSRSSMPSQK